MLEVSMVPCLPKTIVQDEVKIRLFGDSAVVTSRIKPPDGARGTGLTNVYIRRQGRWCCVASQMLWIVPVQDAEPSLRPRREKSHKSQTKQLFEHCWICKRSFHCRDAERPSPGEFLKKQERAFPVEPSRGRW